METSCTNEGCNQKFLKKDKEKHENSNCQWRIIHCGQCMDKVRAFELKVGQFDNEFEKICDWMSSKCTRNVEQKGAIEFQKYASSAPRKLLLCENPHLAKTLVGIVSKLSCSFYTN